MQGNAAWGDFHSICETMPSPLQIILPGRHRKELHILEGTEQARNSAKKEAGQNWSKTLFCSTAIQFYEKEILILY